MKITKFEKKIANEWYNNAKFRSDIVADLYSYIEGYKDRLKEYDFTIDDVLELGFKKLDVVCHSILPYDTYEYNNIKIFKFDNMFLNHNMKSIKTYSELKQLINK